jgi:phospholipid-binding lipoprotein MlaA
MPFRSVRAVIAIGALAALSACVTLPPNSPRSKADPLESWNRGVYRVNDKLDRAVAKPIAKGYVKVVPRPIRTGVSNVFANMRTPTVLVNDALQGKFHAAANDLGRFMCNTIFGLGGIFDPATRAGLDKNDEDFGQTLGKWGVPAGPFLELPLLGPSDLRDGPALVADVFTNPQKYIPNDWAKYSLYVVDVVDKRASLLSLDDTLSKVYDPYAFVRDAYLQRRAYLVSDGAVSDEPYLDPDADVPDGTPAAAPAPLPRGEPAPNPASPPQP